jgi:hypothetical protein
MAEMEMSACTTGVKAKEQAIEELRFKKGVHSLLSLSGVHIDIHPLPFRDLSETNASPYRQSRPLTSREKLDCDQFLDGRPIPLPWSGPKIKEATSEALADTSVRPF